MMKPCFITLILYITTISVYAQNYSSPIIGSFSSTSSEATLLEIRTPESLPCNIKLETHDLNSVEGEYRIWAEAKNIDQEKRFMKMIEVKLDEYSGNEQTVRIRVLAPKNTPWQGSDYIVRAELNITVPVDFKVDSRSMYGKVSIEGPLQYVEVDCEYGSVEVNNIIGETNIRTSYADIEVSDLEGIINIESLSSDIFASNIVITDEIGVFTSSDGELELANIKGPIEASTSNDDITVFNLDAEAGEILLRTNYGMISGSKISGELVAQTSYQPIDLEGIRLISGFCKFETMYSPINVEIVEIGDSHLLINNTYNAINLILPINTSSRLILTVGDGGKIHTKGLSIKPIAMDKNRLDGIVGNGLSRIEANVSGIGEINIRSRR